MWKYVLKRIGLAIVTACIILSLTFILMKMLPFNPPIGTNDARRAGWDMLVQNGEAIRSDVPLNYLGKWDAEFSTTYGKLFYYRRPIMDQYFLWIYRCFIKWDWGVSQVVYPNVDCVIVIREGLKVSMPINIIATILSVPLGILLGICAALKKNKTTDNIISTSVMVFISIPSFVLITLFLATFAYGWQILPSMWPKPSDPIKTKVLGYIIPVLCLSFGSICGYARFTRAELCEVMESDYLLLARTKGLTKRQAILRHALKNAMVPIVPSILSEFIGILGGSMILESLYCIPGIGGLYLNAFNAKDYNLLFVDMALFTSIGLLAGIVLDLSYGFIDPRIRMGAR